jgi:hypothetical protein
VDEVGVELTPTIILLLELFRSGGPFPVPLLIVPGMLNPAVKWDKFVPLLLLCWDVEGSGRGCGEEAGWEPVKTIINLWYKKPKERERESQE